MMILQDCYTGTLNDVCFREARPEGSLRYPGEWTILSITIQEKRWYVSGGGQISKDSG